MKKRTMSPQAQDDLTEKLAEEVRDPEKPCASVESGLTRRHFLNFPDREITWELFEQAPPFRAV